MDDALITTPPITVEALRPLYYLFVKFARLQRPRTYLCLQVIWPTEPPYMQCNCELCEHISSHQPITDIVVRNFRAPVMIIINNLSKSEGTAVINDAAFKYNIMTNCGQGII